MTIRQPFRLALAVLTFAAHATFWACAKETAEEVESESAVSVKATAATRGTVRGVIHATGVVTPAAGADLVVVAPEGARIAEIPRAVGDRVHRGDLLVRFELPNSAAEVQRQQAEVTRAQASLDNAQAAQTRARDLFDRGVAARKEVEEANRGVSEAEAALTEARASLAAARTLAGRAVVRATFDGIVARRLHNPGDLVEATSGDPVLRIIDPRRLEVVAAVPLGDAPRVEVGAAAVLMLGATGAPEIRLKVISRPAAVETGTATIPVRLAFSSPANFAAGTPVQVDIEAEQHKDVVVVPAVAIVREGEETAVFVVSGGKAQRRHVQTGLSDGTQVEILSGVKAGEMVLVDGQAGLPDGASITLANDQGEQK
jgi:RND family efflux transporter MFP subunit